MNNFIAVCMLSLGVVTGIVSGNGVISDETENEVVVSYDEEMVFDIQEDYSNDSSSVEDIRQAIFLLQMSVDSLVIGIELLIKIGLVISVLLTLIVGSHIADHIIHWFTR